MEHADPVQVIESRQDGLDLVVLGIFDHIFFERAFPYLPDILGHL